MLDKISDDDLKKELERRELLRKLEHVFVAHDFGKPDQAWLVTTEADCEGRNTRNLGVYVGHIGDIALSLANHCYYSLKFHPQTHISKKDKSSKLEAKSVNISLDISSNTWKMNKDEIVAAIQKWIGNKFVVTPCNYYASVTISRS